MNRQEQKAEGSVLDGKHDVKGGMQSTKKSAVERAREDKSKAKDCDSALDGPACIDGVEKKSQRT